MARLKSSVVKVKENKNSLSHALIIAIAEVDNNPNYTSSLDGRNIRPIVRKLLVKTGIDLSGVGDSRINKNSKSIFVSITIYQGLACEGMLFEGQFDSLKRINILYDDDERHYHVIVNITGAMARL